VRPPTSPLTAPFARELREARQRKVARSLSHVDLVRSSDERPLTEQDLLDRERGRLFLDYYGDEGIRTALERYGLLGALRRRGYEELAVETRTIDERHMVIVTGQPAGGGERARLIELVVRRDRMVPRLPGAGELLRESYEVLTIDWLLLASPASRFSAERPRLPGQTHPGLGVGWRVLSILMRIVERLDLDALVTVAEYVHNAELYARELPFLDPEHAGRLDALVHALRMRERLTVAQASWALEWGLVHDASGAPLRWRGELQVSADEPTIAEWVESEAYAARARAASAACVIVLDRDAFEARWQAEHDTLEQ
jgi:hypothetical protein